jgi:outer membrane lipoprotein-sorting protein
MSENTYSTDKNTYSIKKAVFLMVIFICAMVLFPVVLSFTAEYPNKLKEHYLKHETVYWRIQQISISPIFDEPESALVELYFRKPDCLFIVSPDQQIYASDDTAWTYLVNHKQIQRAIGTRVFNPFDFLDTSQTFYEILKVTGNNIALKSIDETMEPDSLDIYFADNGAVSRVEYLDTNGNKVIFDIKKESFSKIIPADNFVIKRPAGVEFIDISE